MPNVVPGYDPATPLTSRQHDILIGSLLGDGNLQPLSSGRARLRWDHSVKQAEYLWWKYNEFANFIHLPPAPLVRFNPIFRNTYQYLRCQTLAADVFGDYYRLFYCNRRKVIPETIVNLLSSPLSLAVWYMDDGSLDRWGSSEIYVPFSDTEATLLLKTLKHNFGLEGKIHHHKGVHLAFSVTETQKLVTLIRPYVLPLFEYKLTP